MLRPVTEHTDSPVMLTQTGRRATGPDTASTARGCPVSQDSSGSRFLRMLADGYARCGISDAQQPLLLAVSGGPDSMALLYGTVRLWPDRAKQIHVGHVDHQLRGNAGAEDRCFVEQAAAALNLTCHSTEIPAGKIETASGESLEEAARRLRYEALQTMAETAGASVIVCAHHQDDQVETILHHIIRGTGLRGLQGMHPVRILSSGRSLLRPMLGIARCDVLDFLKQHGCSWREDASNRTGDRTRSRIRTQLLPLLREQFNPQVDHSLLRLSFHARDAALLDEQAAECCLKDVLLECQTNVCRLNRPRLVRWPEPIVRSALRLLWRQQNWPQQSLTTAHWDRLTADLQNPNTCPSSLPGVRISATPELVRLFVE